MKISEKQLTTMMHYLWQIVQLDHVDEESKKRIGWLLSEINAQQSTELKEVE